MTMEQEDHAALRTKVTVLRTRWNVLVPRMVAALRNDTPRSNVEIDAELEALEEDLARVSRAVREIRMMWRQ